MFLVKNQIIAYCFYVYFFIALHNRQLLLAGGYVRLFIEEVTVFNGDT